MFHQHIITGQIAGVVIPKVHLTQTIKTLLCNLVPGNQIVSPAIFERDFTWNFIKYQKLWEYLVLEIILTDKYRIF